MRFTGIILIVSLISITLLASAQQTKPEASDFVILGSVFMSKAEPDPNLPRFPITYDPHFEILVKVQKVLSGSSPWAAGTSVVFIIHSPGLMFHTYDMSGQNFVFTFTPEPDNSWCRYCLKDLQPEKKK